MRHTHFCLPPARGAWDILSVAIVLGLAWVGTSKRHMCLLRVKIMLFFLKTLTEVLKRSAEDRETDQLLYCMVGTHTRTRPRTRTRTREKIEKLYFNTFFQLVVGDYSSVALCIPRFSKTMVAVSSEKEMEEKVPAHISPSFEVFAGMWTRTSPLPSKAKESLSPSPYT